MLPAKIGTNSAPARRFWRPSGRVHRAGDVPPVLAIQMDDAVEELLAAMEDEDPMETRQAALDVARAALDLQLPYVGALQADLGALQLWTVQLGHDADTGERGDIAGDVAALEAVWDRVDSAVAAEAAEQVDAALAELRAAADDEALAEAAELAAELDTLLAEIIETLDSGLEGDDGAAGVDPEFGEDMADVGRDRAVADAEGRGDLAVGPSRREQGNDLPFAAGQTWRVWRV